VGSAYRVSSTPVLYGIYWETWSLNVLRELKFKLDTEYGVGELDCFA
jgi:hypothetical protein